MTTIQYIEQQKILGVGMHLHDGVWWQQAGPFICKPAIWYQRIQAKEARPAWYRSLAGYAHLVPGGTEANAIQSLMVYERDITESFTLVELSSKRRSQVRRGQKKCIVRRIDSLKPYKEDIRKLIISNSIRTGTGKSEKYYRKHYESWWQSVCRRFEMHHRPWWGAFVDGRLVAYYQATWVENRLSIGAAKSHSDYLSLCPNDLLLFTVMETAFNQYKCNVVEYGEYVPDDANLTYYKESYGFKRRDYPRYVSLNSLTGAIYRHRMSARNNDVRNKISDANMQRDEKRLHEKYS